jgi:hypothetical protein
MKVILSALCVTLLSVSVQSFNADKDCYYGGSPVAKCAAITRDPAKCPYSYLKFNKWLNTTLIGKPLKLATPGLNGCEKQCLKTPDCNIFQVFITTKVPNCYLFKEIYDSDKEDSENPNWGKDREGIATAGVDPTKYSSTYLSFATYLWKECWSYNPNA